MNFCVKVSAEITIKKGKISEDDILNGKSTGLLLVVMLMKKGMTKEIIVINGGRIKMDLKTAIKHALDGNAILF